MKDRDTLFILYRRKSGTPGGARVDLRMVAFFGILLMILGLAGWLYLRQASDVTDLAHEIRQLELEKEALHRELVLLQAEVAMLGSLNRILYEGIAMGYVLPDASDPSAHLLVECREECDLSHSAVATGGWTGVSARAPQTLWQRLVAVVNRWVPDWVSGMP